MKSSEVIISYQLSSSNWKTVDKNFKPLMDMMGSYRIQLYSVDKDCIYAEIFALREHKSVNCAVCVKNHNYVPNCCAYLWLKRLQLKIAILSMDDPLIADHWS